MLKLYSYLFLIFYSSFKNVQNDFININKLSRLNLSYIAPSIETAETSLQGFWEVRKKENPINSRKINPSFNPLLTQNKTACAGDLEALINELLPNLPSYTNRVIQRTASAKDETQQIYIILAGKAEFEPLPLNSEILNSEQLQQVFITTLERQYNNKQIVQIQRYHWLFFQPTEKGWQLVQVFSKSNANPGVQRLLEPNDTSKSAIAEAIRLWLRDCQ